ncbi:MAG: MBL fold metallo-hydrolase [bacterium]|nr:MBL fold metallo-hydrolase [bacterium]
MSPLRRRRWGLGLAVAAVLIVVLLLALSGCTHGHVIRHEFAPNHPGDFDFSEPPCSPASRPEPRPDDALLRYLGTAGVHLEWRGHAVLLAPFFSRYGMFDALWGRVEIDEEAVERGLSGLPLSSIDAVLLGHSHFDHVADLPAVMRRLHSRTPAYVNRSAKRMLEAYPELALRATDLEPRIERWTQLKDADGNPSPIRFMPLLSEHADHLGWLHYAPGTVKKDWDSWNGRGLRAMKEGATYSFLVDLLDEDGSPAFRVFLQDSSSSAPHGFPPDEVLVERAVDLAILCLPGFWNTEGYPEGIVAHTHAGHVMAVHYEDFFRPDDEPLRFVATLTDGRAHEFLRRATAEVRDAGSGPEPCTCGPCSRSSSMPLPGEWIRFRTGATP